LTLKKTSWGASKKRYLQKKRLRPTSEFARKRDGSGGSRGRGGNVWKKKN